METSYPSDYIPESTPTNEGGTQISTVTYSRQGQNHTTDMLACSNPQWPRIMLIHCNRAFPTAFVNWPDTYGWKGTLGVEVSPGITDCITASTTSTMISILSNPQDPSILRPSESIQDTLGLTYSLLPGYWDYQLFYPEKTLFPDRSVIQTCCSSIDGGPNMAPFTVTSWTTISSTSYEGDDVASTNTDSISTAQSENTVISTPSETGGSSTSSTTPDSGVTPTSQPGATSTSQHTSTVGEEGTQSSSASPSESSGGGTQQSRGARDFGFYRTQCFVLSLVLVHAMIILLL